jgi:hypothetical protein
VMRIKTVTLDRGTPWRVDHVLGVVYLSAELGSDDAPGCLRDALDVLYPRVWPALRLVG